MAVVGGQKTLLLLLLPGFNAREAPYASSPHAIVAIAEFQNNIWSSIERWSRLVIREIHTHTHTRAQREREEREREREREREGGGKSGHE